MSPTLFRQLNHNVRGWSDFYVNFLDVIKIISINWHPRLFCLFVCLFDSKYKYTLQIKYYNPRSVLTSSPVFTTGSYPEVALTHMYQETSIMTIRY